MVISGSSRAGDVAEEIWDQFASGKQVSVDGYPSKLPPHEVVRRARGLIGALYRLLSFNCEHLIAAAHGLRPASPQLAAMIGIAAVAAVLWAVQS
jgi:hypothetical protein